MLKLAKKSSQVFIEKFAMENFEVFTYDSYGFQIQTEGRSVLVKEVYKIWLCFVYWIASYKPLNGVK